MQNEQRETRQNQREEKKARALETSLSRAEIEDQTVSTRRKGCGVGTVADLDRAEDTRGAKVGVGTGQGCVSQSPVTGSTWC
jgi:hypothetical protein